MISTRSTILTCAVIVLAPLAVFAQGGDRAWEVRGRWTENPGEDVSFGWFSSQASADNYIAQTRRAYGSGGLMETAPNKPLGLYRVDPKDDGSRPRPQAPSLLQKVLATHEKYQPLSGELKENKDKFKEFKEVAKDLKDAIYDTDKWIEDKAKKGKDKLAEAQGISDYLKNVKDSYQRVKDAKDKMMSLDQSLMDKQFKSVNDLIARYNKEVASGAGRYGKYAEVLPKLGPVGPETAKKVGEWNQAVKEQFALERQKEELDRRKADLDSQRQKLADEWKALAADGKTPDPADPKVVSLRNRLDRYREEAEEYSTALGAYQSDAQKLLATIKRVGGRTIDLMGTRWARREGPRPALAAQNAAVVIDFGPKGRWVHSKDDYVFGTWHQEGNRIVIDGFTYTGEPPRKLNFRATGNIDGETIKLDVVEDPYAPDVDPTPLKLVWIFDMVKK